MKRPFQQIQDLLPPFVNVLVDRHPGRIIDVSLAVGCKQPPS
mgnify:CR=1 FL=1